MDLEDNYSRKITDLSTTYTMVVMNGRRKTVSNYGEAAPSKLWAIEKLIDDLMTKAEWRDSPVAPDKER